MKIKNVIIFVVIAILVGYRLSPSFWIGYTKMVGEGFGLVSKLQSSHFVAVPTSAMYRNGIKIIQKKDRKQNNPTGRGPVHRAPSLVLLCRGGEDTAPYRWSGFPTAGGPVCRPYGIGKCGSGLS